MSYGAGSVEPLGGVSPNRDVVVAEATDPSTAGPSGSLRPRPRPWRKSIRVVVIRMRNRGANWWAFPDSLVASDTSIKAALEPVKLFQGSCERGRDIDSRLAVQTLSLDKPGTGGRIPERAFQVSSGLGVVMRTLATGSFTSGNLKPAEPDVVHDHIRPCERGIAAITCIGVRIGAGHAK